MNYLGIPIFGINRFDELDKDVSVIISLFGIEDTVKKMLESSGYKGRVFGITDLVD
jgi:hypothetical protein